MIARHRHPIDGSMVASSLQRGGDFEAVGGEEITIAENFCRGAVGEDVVVVEEEGAIAHFGDHL